MEDAPPELEALSVASRFGWQAIPGLSPRLARRMVLLERVQRAYHNRAASDNWAEWAKKNPDDNDLLIWLVRCDSE